MMNRDLNFIYDKLTTSYWTRRSFLNVVVNPWHSVGSGGHSFIPIIIISSKTRVIDLISLRWLELNNSRRATMNGGIFVEFLCVLRANRANLLLSPSRLAFFDGQGRPPVMIYTKTVFTTHFLMIISGTEYRRLPRKICCRLHDANLSLSIRRRRRCERTRWWAVAAASESGDVSVEMSSLDSDDPRLRKMKRMNFLIIFQIPMIRQNFFPSAQ